MVFLLCARGRRVCWGSDWRPHTYPWETEDASYGKCTAGLNLSMSISRQQQRVEEEVGLLMAGDPKLPVSGIVTENLDGCYMPGQHETNTPCSVHPSAVLQQVLLVRRPSSGNRPGAAVQLRQLADCSEVRRRLGLPALPSTARCRPSCDGVSNPLQRQQVSLETVSEPQMTRRIRRLTFARRLK